MNEINEDLKDCGFSTETSTLPAKIADLEQRLAAALSQLNATERWCQQLQDRIEELEAR